MPRCYLKCDTTLVANRWVFGHTPLSVMAGISATIKGRSVTESNAFFSIWNQDANYWLVVEGAGAAALEGFTVAHHKPNMAAKKTGPEWRPVWEKAFQQLTKQPGAATGIRAAVVAAEELPSLQEIGMVLKPCAEVNAVADNLWLIDYVNHGRLGCYMQRVIDRRGKLVGYEAFARMESADGGVIGGGAIMQAAHALRVEYQLDRILHKHAIDCFVDADLEGYVFINFLTGFIHRPEVYLEGLSQAVSRRHVRPAAVVLDVPLQDYVKDMAKLKSIASYCRTRGFGLALDDVNASEGLAALLDEIRPSFVKLDGKFGAGMNPAKAQGILHEIVRISHANGVSVLAEGVESQGQHESLLAAEVDMFQGYLFGAPERYPRVVDAAVKTGSVG